ncbi:MAG TPA: FmdB family zinc ribbon protein [Acidimicrobiia bacterium]|jgi:putative FmdB family regulatory protein|nr:FmdB family zinc ribbon protein [Acidimicrobiia bacterium]
MPTYEYRCTNCDEHLEVVQSFSDDPLTECPKCGGTLRKVFSPVGIILKGSGFYKTDSRGSGKKAKEKETSSSSSSDSSSSSSDSSSSKSDSSSSKSDSSSSKSDSSSSGSSSDKSSKKTDSKIA